MPKLIEETPIPTIPAEWTKEGKDYKRGPYLIQPLGSKFALYDDGHPICKGPLKICQGFAADIIAQLLKLGSPIKVEPKVPKAKGKIVDRIHAGGGIMVDIVETKTTIEQALESATKLEAEAKEALAEVQEEIDPDNNDPIHSGEPLPYEEIPIAHTLSHSPLKQAIALLSRPIQINQLPNGSHFSLDGRFGTFVEMVGNDAKVEWEGKAICWSGATTVKWAAELPKAVEKSPRKQQAESVPTGEIAPVEKPKGDIKVVAHNAPPKALSKPRGNGIFGFATKRVVMALAVRGWKEEEIVKAVNGHFKADVGASSIRGWSKNAINGKDGDPAALTAEQIKELESIRKKK